MLMSTIDLLIDGRSDMSTAIKVIDNGSETPLNLNSSLADDLIRNESNVGMIESLQQAKDNCTADILAFFHSDLLIHEGGWDAKIIQAFESDPRLGLLGVVGGSVAASNGGRANVLCSFRNGHAHGQQTPPGVHPAVLLDGCCMIFRREAMNAIPDDGFPAHHFHDKDWSVQMIMNGYRVGVIQLDCEHLGGRTSCQPECQESFKKWGGEQAIYEASERRYLQKWGAMLPIRVDAAYNYSTRAGPVFV